MMCASWRISLKKFTNPHKKIMDFSYQDHVESGKYAGEPALNKDSGYDITAFVMAVEVRIFFSVNYSKVSVDLKVWLI